MNIHNSNKLKKLDELKLSKELMLPYKLMPINISIGSPSNTESLNFIFFSVNTYEFLNKSITINIINQKIRKSTLTKK